MSPTPYPPHAAVARVFARSCCELISAAMVHGSAPQVGENVSYHEVSCCREVDAESGASTHHPDEDRRQRQVAESTGRFVVRGRRYGCDDVHAGAHGCRSEDDHGATADAVGKVEAKEGDEPFAGVERHEELVRVGEAEVEHGDVEVVVGEGDTLTLLEAQHARADQCPSEVLPTEELEPTELRLDCLLVLDGGGDLA
jgi:hypothetical protein